MAFQIDGVNVIDNNGIAATTSNHRNIFYQTESSFSGTASGSSVVSSANSTSQEFKFSNLVGHEAFFIDATINGIYESKYYLEFSNNGTSWFNPVLLWTNTGSDIFRFQINVDFNSKSVRWGLNSWNEITDRIELSASGSGTASIGSVSTSSTDNLRIIIVKDGLGGSLPNGYAIGGTGYNYNGAVNDFRGLVRLERLGDIN